MPGVLFCIGSGIEPEGSWQSASGALQPEVAYADLRRSDGSMPAIDCDAAENGCAKTIRHRSALDYLLYNAPLEYAELVLCGDVEGYLRNG